MCILSNRWEVKSTILVLLPNRCVVNSTILVLLRNRWEVYNIMLALLLDTWKVIDTMVVFLLHSWEVNSTMLGFLIDTWKVKSIFLHAEAECMPSNVDMDTTNSKAPFPLIYTYCVYGTNTHIVSTNRYSMGNVANITTAVYIFPWPFRGTQYMVNSLVDLSAQANVWNMPWTSLLSNDLYFILLTDVPLPQRMSDIWFFMLTVVISHQLSNSGAKTK